MSPCPYPATITITPRAPPHLLEAMDDREGWRERIMDVLMTLHDDDEEEDDDL